MSLFRDFFEYRVFDGILPTPNSGCVVGVFRYNFHDEDEDKMIMIYEGALITDERITDRVSAYIKSNDDLTRCNSMFYYLIDGVMYIVISYGHDNRFEVFQELDTVEWCRGYNDELTEIDGVIYF